MVIACSGEINKEKMKREKEKRNKEAKEQKHPKLRTVEGRTRGRGFFPPSRRPWGGTG
jgi:hypothetical protein